MGTAARGPASRQCVAVWLVLLCGLLLLDESNGGGATSDSDATPLPGVAVVPRVPSLDELAATAKQRWLDAKRAESLAHRSERPRAAPGPRPRAPRLPLQFKAKGRARVAYNYDGLRELLAVLHYDYPNRRLRLDLYYINPGKVQRYYTGIWDYRARKQFMIFHRIKDYPLPSPHGCMIVPTVGKMLHPHVVEHDGIWMGKGETVVDAVVGESQGKQTGIGNKEDIADRTNSDNVTTAKQQGIKNMKSTRLVSVPTNHWFVPWEGEDWNYYESTAAGKPVRLERHKKNVDVHFLHFEEGSHTVHPDLFDPDTVAATKCTPIGSSRSRRRPLTGL